MLAPNQAHCANGDAGGFSAAGWENKEHVGNGGMLVRNPAPAASPSSAPSEGYTVVTIERK